MTILDNRAPIDQHPINVGGTLVCGATFDTADGESCEYGNGIHDCWNDDGCNGFHVCPCGAVPAYIENWLNAHEDTNLDLALDYLEVQPHGAVVCKCCGVNFNDDVDQD